GAGASDDVRGSEGGRTGRGWGSDPHRAAAWHTRVIFGRSCVPLTTKTASGTTAIPGPDLLHHFLYQMILIRRFEERSAEMYTKGKIRGFLHLYIGEEACAVGS